MADKPNLAQIVGRLAKGWVQVHALGRRVPLLVAWNLTFHCNLRCHYCACPTLHVPELKTPLILESITEFHKRGMRWVTFSGGEPLLRNDIGQIVDHAKNLGIVVFISTNGTLLPRRIEAIKRADKITISLDGGERIHDEIRGAGSFAQATRAIELSQDHNIPVGLTCVVSAHNLDTIEEVLELADAYGIACMFQPATKWLNSHTDPNPIAPETAPYRAALDRLIALKRQGAPIANSMAGLKYLRSWPDGQRIWSTAGRLTCTVESDGKVISSHITQTEVLPVEREDDNPPWVNYEQLVIPEYNEQSWCAPILELDLLFSLNPSAIGNSVLTHRPGRYRKYAQRRAAMRPVLSENNPVNRGN
jgi:MoaA/NifB/PqqE/SkfB family radical SAM enzyme